MVTQSTPDGTVLEPETVQRPLTVSAPAPEVDVQPKVFEIDDLEVYYGPFRAVREVTLDVRKSEITAFIGPSGCGKTTVLRCLNRMNDLIPGARVVGSVRYRGSDLYASSVSPSEVRRHIGMVFQKPNPFPKSIYDNVAFGPRVNGVKKKSVLDDVVEKSLRGAALWDEVKDRLKHSAARHVGWSAAAPVHRPRDRRRARGDSHGRTLFGARPDRDGSHRGADARDQRALHDRHRDAQHAAGCSRERSHRFLHR